MWHVSGIGFQVENVPFATVKTFITGHKEALRRYKNYDKVMQIVDADGENEAERFEDLRQMTDDQTVSEIIAFIMTKETGIPFESPGLTDESEEAVMYYAKYPWGLTTNEIGLTRKTLQDILDQYADELGIPKKERGDLDLVYSG